MPSNVPLGQVWPDLDGFRALARDHRVVPVTRRVLADTDTPLGLFTRLAGHRVGSFLLESAERDGSWGRWSFVGVRSAATLSSRPGTGSRPQAHWTGAVPHGVPTSGDLLDILRATLDELRTAPFEGLPPLTGGLVGFLGWDVAAGWENLPRAAVDDLGLPGFALCLATDLAVVDHRDASVWLIANAVNHDGSDARVDEAWRDAVARLDQMTHDLAAPATARGPLVEAHSGVEPDVHAAMRPESFARMVDAAQQAIADGEVFQVVVSQRFSMELPDVDPIDLYRALRVTNPSPYMYLLNLADADGAGFAVVGSSPESLVRVAVETHAGGTHRTIASRPIAGTKPRSGDPVVDDQRTKELLDDPKERAEHLMLVDLARNDLSRVCLAGTVTVEEYMQVQTLSHVLHIASTVRGRLRPDASAVDAVTATFPAGTLSGAPKVRAMELIDAFEPTRRGPYGGAVGYLDFAGNVDLAIAIRTGVLRSGTLYVQAGAGIVADSVPQTEYDESRSKSAAVLRAGVLATRLRPVS